MRHFDSDDRPSAQDCENRAWGPSDVVLVTIAVVVVCTCVFLFFAALCMSVAEAIGGCLVQ
jgi:hypothetical protein